MSCRAGAHQARAASPMKVIDPFTFYSCFNRGLKEENRIAILANLKAKLGLESEVPDDFDGIPVVNPLKAWFFPYADKRGRDDISTLWTLAEAVVKAPPESLDPKLVDRCLAIETIGLPKLTMGMFWLNPKQYIACDKNNRTFFKRNGINLEVGNPH